MHLIYYCTLFILITSFTCHGVSGPLTLHFQAWLNASGYAKDDFVREDYGTQGSYGGRNSSSQKIVKIPVIFIHGNTDTALQTDSFSTGWDNTIAYFVNQGYTTAELYATSWGDNRLKDSSQRTHSCAIILRLRRFVQAVISYTGAQKVSIVSHSMGVTLARKIVKGGHLDASDGGCQVGNPILKDIHVFLGLAGANYGMCNCEGVEAYDNKSCNKKDGFWPGDFCGANNLLCGAFPLPFPCNNNSVTYSAYLMDLNRTPQQEGDQVFSVWSLADNVIDYNDRTWGHPTSLIPNSTGKKIYNVYNHMQTKELTADDQYIMVNDARIPN